jgi:hypothetical protein
MIKPTFEGIVKKLSVYYGLTGIVSQDRFDQWYARIKDIPEGAVDYVVRTIEHERDTMPRNLPRAMHQAYESWRSMNADKMIGYQRTSCDGCGGSGFLWVWDKTEAGARYQAVYRCADCENWRRDIHPAAMPATTRERVIMDGREMVDGT